MKSKIIGKIKVVVCIKCYLIQDWNKVIALGHCTQELSKFKKKCNSLEFEEII